MPDAAPEQKEPKREKEAAPKEEKKPAAGKKVRLALR